MHYTGKELLYLHEEGVTCEMLFSTLAPNLRQLRIKSDDFKPSS